LWIAAVCVGAAAVLFAKLADAAQWALRRMLERSELLIWLLAPLGFCCIAWVTRRYFRGAEGSGIPQTIFALRSDAGAEGLALLLPKVAIGRIVLAAAGLFCGASVGREGPTVHVGAAIAAIFHRWIPHGDTSAQRRTLVLAGGAAGVAAAFNTPLAGIVFAIEELSKSFEERASGATLTAVVLAGVIAIALTGDYTYFGQPTIAASETSISFFMIAAALAFGVTGGLFSRLTLTAVNGLPGVLGVWQKRFPVSFAAGCGIAVAAMAVLCNNLTVGTGYVEAKSVIESHAHLPWFYAPARALATLLAYLSGIPAGLLAPSLSVGAGMGQYLADVCGLQTPVPLAILGMCGFLAAVTQAPLTSLVIVMEMTGQHAMVLPLMVTAALATAASKFISAPLYQTLALRYLPGSPSLAVAGEANRKPLAG
jgi:H+/Cl- antiporter ClcA